MMNTLESVRSVLGPMVSERKCREVVLAVLEGLQVPTASMRAALIELWASEDREKQALHYGVSWTSYRAMIDALIAELSPANRSKGARRG